MAVYDAPAGPVHYALEGSGPMVTLIHGVGSDLESWDGVVTAMGPGYRILRYDLRGHGRSARIRGRYEIGDFVADLAGLLDHLKIARTHLVGFSLGGIIAQGFALAHADRIERLALVSAVAGRTPEERDTVMQRYRALGEGGGSSHVSASLSRWFTDEFIAANRDLIEQRLARGRTTDPECYAAAYRVLAECDLGDELHAITAPTLVMTGEHDQGSNARMSRLMAERIPDSRLHILDRLKHSILVEAPDVVAEKLVSFLQSEAAK